MELSGGRMHVRRSRWAAVGAAVAVSIGGGGLFVANAASSPASSVVTIDPVRILDTRTDLGLPGPFVSPASQKLQVTGAVVPVGATGVLLNATVVGPKADGFLSIRPGDATGAPSTSSLNFKAGDVTPNSVQVGLPTSGVSAGQIDIRYDALGVTGPTTEVLIDVVGYLIAGGGGAGVPGPKGETGSTGAPGQPGQQGQRGSTGLRGLSAWEVIPPDITVTGALVWDSHSLDIDDSDRVSVDLPGVAPTPLTSDDVNFAGSELGNIVDADSTCTGTVGAPTAPAGKVCIYLSDSGGIDPDPGDGLSGEAGLLPTRSFEVSWVAAGVLNADEYVYATWAYRAP